MATLQKDGIMLSIPKQLNLKDKVIVSKINNIIENADITNYEDVKLLSKQIKEYLHSKNILIKHTQVLNTLSKALGYQNHHSLKSNLEKVDNTIQIDIENDSNLKKLFIIKNEFITKFGIDVSYIAYFVHKGIEFEFIYHKYGAGSRTKKSIEINKYLKSYRLKLYRNTIPLCKIKSNNLQKVAFNILQQYQSFFTPYWYEPNTYSSRIVIGENDWYMLSYSNIKHINDLLIVDSCSSDLHWNVVNNFLDYIINFGTIKDIEFFESCLKRKSYSYGGRMVMTLAEVRRIRSWKKQQLLLSIVKNKKNSIRETLDSFKYQFDIQPYMHPFIVEFEDKENKSIKDIIIENCDYFFNYKKKYTINNIKNKLSLDLLKKDMYQYIDEMEEIDDDDIELYKNYDSKYNSMVMIANKVEDLIDMFNEVNQNYEKYYQLLRSRSVH